VLPNIYVVVVTCLTVDK